MIYDANWVRGNVTVGPSPLHDGVHPLPSATGCLSLRQPDRAQDVCAVAGADRVEFAIAELGEDVGFERADPLRGVLLILPAGLQFFVDFAGRIFESKSRGGNGCHFSISVSLVDRIFSVIDELAHGKRFVPGPSDRDFWIGAEPGVPTLAGYGAGEA